MALLDRHVLIASVQHLGHVAMGEPLHPHADRLVLLSFADLYSADARPVDHWDSGWLRGSATARARPTCAMLTAPCVRVYVQ
jgi:hypothetical protein